MHFITFETQAELVAVFPNPLPKCAVRRINVDIVIEIRIACNGLRIAFFEVVVGARQIVVFRTRHAGFCTNFKRRTFVERIHIIHVGRCEFAAFTRVILIEIVAHD